MTTDLVTTVTSILGVVLSLLGVAVSYFTHRLSVREKLSTAGHKRFTTEIDSDDIRFLHRYLMESISQFTVYEYASDPDVRAEVERYFGCVREIEVRHDVVLPTDSDREDSDLREVPLRFRQVMVRLTEGNSFEALALLRRLVETVLRVTAVSHGWHSPRPASALALMEFLHGTGELSDAAAAGLRYSITICNRAIHGLPVPVEDAEAAVKAVLAHLPESLDEQANSLEPTFVFDELDPAGWTQALRFHSDDPKSDRFIAHGVIDDPLVCAGGSVRRGTEGSIPHLDTFLELMSRPSELKRGRAHINLFTKSRDGHVSAALKVHFDFDGTRPLVRLEAHDQIPAHVAVNVVTDVARRMSMLPGVARV
ncbi:hypothetical protein HQ560_22055 [bacterium]|nr:hypothetical protein [bacterium]